ncbi:glycoside hydrolase family 128 protein [Aspergillus carbonarius ITEM 5010]|uniref:Glycoside hydrolase family 128 protein n=1 Tax=Aspergillus carbonarius (strain ITEM 5010) TaxID=602072 RepID=A0A1R3RPN9_ASPC5|nr:glycoside hydrolase family 128 protein [Aspergillus carbonarius ITEM 5010]
MVSFTKLLTLGLIAALTEASSKRGAAYNDASLVKSLTSGKSGAVSWSYNWAQEADGTMPSGVKFVPMLWGTGSVSTWTTAVEKALSGGSTHILGFNEPDMTSQADMTASNAATLYKKYITPYGDRATLISPAVTSSENSGQGLSWFKTFMSECTSCNISALAVHWYGGSFAQLESFMTEAISTAGQYDIDEVWLTEFALDADTNGISDAATAKTFLEKSIAWLDSHPKVGGYAYFYTANGYLLTSGSVNSVGDVYVASSSSGSGSSSSSTKSTKTATATKTAKATTSAEAKTTKAAETSKIVKTVTSTKKVTKTVTASRAAKTA